MRLLFLDDSAARHQAHGLQIAALPAEERPEVVRVETFDEAVKALSGERFDVVSLDRDLNDYGKRSIAYGSGMYEATTCELSGEDVAEHIAQLPPEKRPAQAHVHSWNPSGARRMQATLIAAGIPTTYEPFAGPVCLRCCAPIALHEGDNRASLVCPDPVAP